MKTRRIRIIGEMIKKTWAVDDLLSPVSIRADRIRLIEELGDRLSSFPHSRFEQRDQLLVLRQKRLRRSPNRPKGAKLKQVLLSLAAELDLASAMGFVHGDICYKNTIWDGDRIWLVDLEPDLHHRRDGVEKWMVTIPWVAHCDLRMGMVSSATDRISFAALCRRMLYGMPPQLNFRAYFTKRRHSDASLPWGISDSTVEGRTFTELAEDSFEGIGRSNVPWAEPRVLAGCGDKVDDKNSLF